MHQMVSGSLALLYFLLGFHGGRQGSSPDRGQSPVEWGDFPFVPPSVHLSVPPSGPSSQAWLAGPQAWLAGPQAWLDGPEGGTYVCRDKQTNGESPHSTGLRPLSEPLPKKGKKILCNSNNAEIQLEQSNILLM